MSDQTTIYKAVLDVIKAAVGDRIKTYRTGDPIVMAKSDLPMLYVRNASTSVQLDATGLDLRERSLEIGVAVSKLENIQDNAYEKDNADDVLHSIVEGIDDATGTYRLDSVVGALRKNFTLSSRVVGVPSMTIIYRPDPTRSATMITEEAVITMDAQERISVTNRT